MAKKETPKDNGNENAKEKVAADANKPKEDVDQ